MGAAVCFVGASVSFIVVVVGAAVGGIGAGVDGVLHRSVLYFFLLVVGLREVRLV